MKTAAKIASAGALRPDLTARGIGVLTISLAAVLLLVLLLAANRGLDYSDESYAYLWARYPFEYRFALRLSGFFLHPIELLVQHSMTGLRVVGMLLTAACGILIGIVVTHAVDKPGRLERAELVAACGITMFLGDIYWMNTPSYQRMTLWGLALVLAGAAMLIREAPASTAQRLGTAVLIACGGLILAAAKIPSAIAAAALTVGLVFLAYGADAAARWRMLGMIAAVEAVLLAAIAAFVSPAHIVELFREGLSLRAANGDLLDVLAKHLADIRNMPARVIWIFAFATLSIVMTLAPRSPRRIPGVQPSPAALVLGAIATCAALAFANPVRPLLDRYSVVDHGLHMTVLAVAVLVLASAFCRYRNWRYGRERLMLVVLLIVAPWIASLGTGNNFLYHTAAYSAFSGLAIIVATLEMPRLVAQTARLFVVLMSGATLYLAAQYPYRLNRPVLEQNVLVMLEGLNGGVLLVDGPTASFLASLRDGARAAGLSPGTPLFDLAGFGPGFNLALGTKPPVYPWIAGGYPNSPAILDKIWSLTPVAEREQAWIIGPVDPSFSGAVVLSRLVPLDSNYELILRTAEPQSGKYIELWRPRNAAPAGR